VPEPGSFSHLTCIRRGQDSFIVQKRTSKGAALRFVCHLLGPDARITAIGNSNQDIGMLKTAEFAYASSSCSSLVRKLAKQGQCRIVSRRFQTGLLAAVRHRLCLDGARPRAQLPKWPAAADQFNILMQSVLKAADRRIVFQILIALSWWYS
jgi:haloacid dehalogenase-like hydrolase